MPKPALSPPLSEWAEQLERLQWAALIADADWKLMWVSRSLQNFLRVDDTTDLGYGENLAWAWSTSDIWRRSVTPEGQFQLFRDLAPLFIAAMRDRGIDVRELLGEPFSSLVDQVEPAADVPLVGSGFFEYTDPSDPELPPYRVNYSVIRINGDDGKPVGALMITFLDVNPNLSALLVRGDQEMYRRMAKLVDPQPQQGAVLFCDLQGSGRVSRELSSAAYFRMVRRLWTGIDAAIAGECGIVGKHAGDGASAFFLAEDLGSPSKAAAAAIRAARRIHETSADVFGETVQSGCLMRIGVHWGGSLYMGQLVPGGRLDVTALGDEVNEAARVEESATPGTTLVTKQLLERLHATDADSLGLDLEKMRFTVLADLATASEKARRDAGLLAVALID
ncbi:MAG TPA: adenylate/guanylate cyclase domain-containing protein [Actinomycetota bacterium]|nr:adenylate/guanylate cyclase domain-containing protein [Actinomycetota bacterium]